jgi:hypothetical protein
MLLAFIFNEVASETVAELAALAAAATFAMLCGVDIAPEVGPLLLPPPHATNATDSATLAALTMIRRANSFDRIEPVLVTAY